MTKRKDKNKNWYVLYVKTRQEFKVSERLETLGIETYVPYQTEVRQWSDRKKKVKKVLLPSMVLVHIEEKESSQVFSVPGPVRYLFENGVRAQVSEREIEALRYYVEGKYHAEKQGIQVGDTVVVPSLQQEAEVLSIEGKKCFAKLQQWGAVVSFQLS